MSYAPVVPPLPHDFNQPQPRRRNSKPPIPPLPPNFHPEQPLAAPMPERAMPTLPADMARSLDDSLYSAPPSRSSSFLPPSPYPADHRRPSPAPPPQQPGPYGGPGAFPGGFAPPPSGYSQYPPSRTGPSPAPYTSYPPPTSAMSAMSLAPPRTTSAHAYHPYHPQPSPPAPSTRPPDLTVSLPTPEGLVALQRTLPPRPSPDHVPWIRDVLFLVERVVAQQHGAPTTTPPEGPAVLADPVLARLATDAVQILIAFLAASPLGSPLPPPVAEATYLRGTLHSGGAFPALVPRSPRDAFRDFEASARAGVQRAWFRIGRDYEAVGDVARARDCFERGVRAGVESCLYRMGMARLLGQLGLPASPTEALPLLHRAATLASTDVPQPAYVYGLILLGEFSHVRIEERTLASLIPPGSGPQHEARKYVERAAYLGFAPAQYKLGHAYEYAVAPFPFDPLLSVQYYSLASQQGEPEADMALSKWFLCGAEGAFEKDEALAVTFADKAARTGLGSAEFALGYYAEVGVGGVKDIEVARKWYARAVEHGNADAPARLRALTQPAPQALSRTEHDAITDARLVRRRTQARISATAEGRGGRYSNGSSAESGGGGEGRYSGDMLGAVSEASEAEVVEQMRAHARKHVEEHGEPLRTSPQPIQQPAYAHPQSPHPQPAQQRPQQPYIPPAQTRYSLTDAPVGGGGGLPGSPAPSHGHGGHSASFSGQGHSGHGRAAGRPPGRRHESEYPSAAVGVGPGPTSSAPNSSSAGNGGAPTNPASPALPLPANGGPSPGSAATPPKPSGGGAATFAEMGFQSGKAADKECVIM